MNERKRVRRGGALFVLLTLFVGCAGTANVSTNVKHNSLAQERLFLIEHPFVLSHVQPTIAFPSATEIKSKSITTAVKALVDVVAPEFIVGSIDLLGQSIVSFSGKDDQSTTIEATASNFFYKDATYNLTTSENPSFNLLFISGEFGEGKEAWKPKKLDKKEEHAFSSLHLVGKPNFYMEARVFPLPETQYMEVVPSYIFYNRLFNSNGSDNKRDLDVRFSFYKIDDDVENNLLSEGHIVLRDVEVGKEYGEKELADVRTNFMKMPKISDSKKGYSGAYKVKVSVTETRDINEWLASLGESISDSKEKMASKIYLSEEEKIERDTTLAKAKLEVEIIEAQIEEAKLNGATKTELLELEKELLDKKAEANRAAVKYGRVKLY